MVKVEFLGPIDVETKELNINTLKELSEFMLSDEKLREWVDISAVAVNDKIVNALEYDLKSGDKISILPPVCGG